MNVDIRKISVGKDYPNGVIHYQVGKRVNLNGNYYEVKQIDINFELLKVGKIAYDIYIANDNGKVLWKTVVDVPVIIENNIDFE